MLERRGLSHVSDVASVASRPPEIVGGRYLLGRSVGAGSSGTVYLARDRQSGNRYAVKIREAQGREQPVRFIAEARDMARLRHPRLVPVLDSGSDGNLYWFVMPFYAKGSLRDRIKRHGPLDTMDGLDCIFRVLEGLDAVHKSGLVHRDVKPHNVLIDDDDVPVITDFGLVRHVHGGVPYRTRTDQSMGTPNYRAPEQAVDAANVDLRADIYGVGATLYFLLTARRPGFLYMVDEQDPAMAAIDPVIRPFILRCMAYEADERFADARETAVAVAAIAQHVGRVLGRPEFGQSWMKRFDRGGRRSLWERFVNWVMGY
ncbi:MAG: serine/threonine-protein kinase [Myxococcota bacterium]